jgi:peptidoglycan/LPS O-acetylase OafA/YrhL
VNAKKSKSRHIPSIDGLRAIAVAAVVLYHLGVSWIPGGFLGVDLFFVISGYVITRLILDSIERSSALDLREFYRGRARRLLPALLLLITSSALISAIWAPEAMRRLLSDIPYVLTGTNNWRLIAEHQDYFATIGRPPLLQHTWSLAVEAQFYLIWPIVLILILQYFGKRNITRVALAIATISGVALFIFSLHLDSANTQSVSHIYFGTDTHSLGLFLGAALAVSWVPQNLSPRISQRAQDFVDGIGVVGLLGLLSTFLFVTESNPTLYRLAFPLAGIFGCAIITSLVHPSSRFAPLISSKWFLWIGERSYGIYLWHWVIFQVTRPSVDLAGSLLAVNCARILLVLALADISLRFVEAPVRRGVLQNWYRGMKYRIPKVRFRQRSYVVASLVGIIAIFSISASVGMSRGDAINKKILLQNSVTTTVPEISNPTSIIGPNSPNSPKGLWVTGDSVILGIRNKLESHSHIALINARVGRQIQELITVIEADKSQVSGATVILDLGNNNHLTAESVVQLLDLLRAQPKIILVNTAVPRSWRVDNNRIIKRVIKAYPQADLVDWESISEGHPEFFAPDGVHLSDLGGDVYVAAILDKLNT